MKKLTAVILSFTMVFALTGCAGKNQTADYTPIPGLDTDTKATLVIAIPYETNKALNTVANAFMNKYPNVSI